MPEPCSVRQWRRLRCDPLKSAKAPSSALRLVDRVSWAAGDLDPTLSGYGTEETPETEFARHGLLDQLDRWPNLRLERIPSRDQMFRAQWLQQHVHERLDNALERVLARLPAGAASLSAISLVAS